VVETGPTARGGADCSDRVAASGRGAGRSKAASHPLGRGSPAESRSLQGSGLRERRSRT